MLLILIHKCLLKYVRAYYIIMRMYVICTKINVPHHADPWKKWDLLRSCYKHIASISAYLIMLSYILSGPGKQQEEPWISLRLETKDFVLRFRYLRERSEL